MSRYYTAAPCRKEESCFSTFRRYELIPLPPGLASKPFHKIDEIGPFALIMNVKLAWLFFILKILFCNKNRSCFDEIRLPLTQFT